MTTFSKPKNALKQAKGKKFFLLTVYGFIGVIVIKPYFFYS